MYDALARRRGLVLVVAGAVVALALGGVWRLDVRQDMASLVAESDAAGDRAFREAADTLAAFGTLDTLLVEVARAGASRSELEGAADALAATLRESGLFAGVHFRVDAAGRQAVFDAVFPKRFFLFAAPTDYGPGVDAARRDLLSPAAVALKPLVFRDPAGHRDALFARLDAAGPGLALDTSAGTLLSEDGTRALVLVEPRGRALDIPAAEAALEAVAAAAPPGFEVRALGAHLFATSAARSIRGDIHVTVGATLVGVLLFIGLVFRRISVVWPLLVPVVGGAAVAVGVTGWLGEPVHGITLGFGAVLVGVAVDYGIHFLVHAGGRDMREVYAEVAPSITLAAATTLTAVAALALSDNAALQAFARVALLALGAAFLLAVLVLPVSRADWGGSVVRLGRWGEGWGGRPRTVLASGVALTAALAVGLGGVRFDGDMRNLDYQPPEVRALEAEFAERYRHPRSPTLVVARATDAERALQRAEQVASALAASGVGFTSLTAVVPSKRTQKANLKTWGPAQRPALERATRAVGMRVAAFAPFFEVLQRARSGAVGPLEPGHLAGTPLARLAERLLVVGADGARVLTVAHGELDVELADALRAMPGVRLVSAAGVASRAVVGIKRSMSRLAWVSLGLVGLLLGVWYRRLTPVLSALFPVGVALVWTWGVMGWFDVPLNIVSIGAFALVCGLGVDYGVFVTNAAVRGTADARPSVLLAGCTTLLGFGALLLADSPVMWSLGLAVVVGVSSALLAAVVLLPALWAVLGRPTGGPEPVGVALQLAVVIALGLALSATWLAGARVTHGWQVATALTLDVVAAAWLVYRMRLARP